MAKPKLLSVKDINVKKTPNPAKGKRSSKLGRRHELPYTHFVYNLFRINELNTKSDKMTDAEIVRQIRLEYPAKEFDERFSTPEKASVQISRMRSFYNAGTLVTRFGSPEKHLVSFYYDEEGFACNPRFWSPKRYTNEQIEKLREKYSSKKAKKADE